MEAPALKLIAFDMDGTLFNSFSVSYDAIREGFEKFWAEMGVPEKIPPWSEAKKIIGLPSYEFFPALLPEQYREHWEILQKYIGEGERRRIGEGTGRCFDGVHETLDELQKRGYKLGILTNASKRYLDAVLDGCKLRKYFDLEEHLGELLSLDKAAILSQWATSHGGGGNVIYVGDRMGDIESARLASVRAVGVSWGYGTAEELSDAEVIIDRMPDLLRVLTADGMLAYRAAREIIKGLEERSEDTAFVVRLESLTGRDGRDLAEKVVEELNLMNRGVKALSGSENFIDEKEAGRSASDTVYIQYHT